MAALDFKLEYCRSSDGPSDEGCFIQLRSDISAYTTLVSKESYASGSGTESDLATNLFTVPGVVRLALQGFRVYVEKSPVFEWSEVLGPFMVVLQGDVGADSLNELPGSGVKLETLDTRRGFS